MDLISLRLTFCQMYSLLETLKPSLVLQGRIADCHECSSGNVHNCSCVSTLLPSSFSLGRNVSVRCLETGCRPATGFPLPGGKVSKTSTLLLLFFFFSSTMRQSTPIAQIMVYHHMFKEIMGALQFILSFSVCLACHFTPLPVPFLFF